MQAGNFPGHAEKIVSGLGGTGNIGRVSCDYSKLSVTVHDPSLVDKAVILAAPAWQVTIDGNEVGIVVGSSARKVEEKIKSLMS